jgi:TldD protein
MGVFPCRLLVPDLRDLEGGLESSLRRLGPKVSFAEAMAENVSGEMVTMDTRSTNLSSRPRLRGVIFRAWNGARWTESATSQLDAHGLEAAIEQLSGIDRGGAGASPVPGPSSTHREERATRPAKPVRDLGADGMIELARDSLAWATAVPGIKEANIAVAWEENERLYLNTAGARCWQTVSRARAGALAIAMENGRAEVDYLSEGGVGGQELLSFFTEDRLAATGRSALELLHAPAPPSGEMDVVLDPGVAGLFAHESFGHGTEADQFVRHRSYLQPLVGETVAPEFVTISDDGSYPGGWGSIYFDDEGHPGQKTVLVDHGKFVGALHDRETAAVLGAKPTGNTRRADFLSRAFVRMTNTYVEPGDRRLEELVGEVKSGVLLQQGSSGIEDPLGGQMQLKVQRGRKIENGRLTDPLPSMALSGRVLDFLQAIRGVGKADGFSIHPGFCGKGHSDILTAGTGGVYLLSRAIVGAA